MSSLFSLDPRTFMFYISMFSFVMALISFVSVKTLPKKLPGMISWAFSMLSLGLAFLFFMLRGLIPDFFGHFLANLFVLMSAGLMVSSYLIFSGYQHRIAYIWFINLFFFFVLALDYFIVSGSDPANRVIITGLPTSLNLIYFSYLLIRSNLKKPVYASYIPLASIILLSLALIIRVAKAIFGDPATTNIYVQGPTQLILYFSLGAGAIASSIGFIIINIEKMSHDIIDQTTKAQSASQFSALGEMAGNIAHEINNPLAIVSGNLELLDKQIGSSDGFDPKIKKKIENTRIAVNRINEIIKTMRMFTKQSEQSPMSSVACREIISNTLALCSERLKTASYTLVVGELPNVNLICHPFQIVQVLLSLINNAEEALSSNPEFDKKIFLEFKSNIKSLEIQIKNRCNPLPKQVRDRLFDPFFTTKELGKGTGLGLSVSRQVIESHHGSLTFNEADGNIVFIVELPIIL